jgi:hypothetical protein
MEVVANEKGFSRLARGRVGTTRQVLLRFIKKLSWQFTSLTFAAAHSTTSKAATVNSILVW